MQSMRLPFAGLLLSLCIPSFASAQTIISGDVFDGSGGPLVPGGSPYVVPAFSIVSVPAGRTLTIQPGVEVRLAENAYFEVYGTLTSVGSAANHIRLTSNIAGQYWFALIIRSGGSAGLRFCDLEYGGRNSNPMVLVQDAATATLDQSRLRLSQGDGLQGNVGQTGPGNLTITSSLIADNAVYGMNLIRGAAGTLTLSDNVLTGNGAAAYHLGPNIYPS